MKAFYFAISFVVALMMVSACNMDKYELEKNLRTRAGSVNSYGYFYLAEGTLDEKNVLCSDGLAENALRLIIGQIDKNSVNMMVISVDEKNPDPWDDQIVAVSTSDITLSGKAGDVSFSQDSFITAVILVISPRVVMAKSVAPFKARAQFTLN